MFPTPCLVCCSVLRWWCLRAERASERVFQTKRNPDIDHLVVWVYFGFLYSDWVWCGFRFWRRHRLPSGRSHRCLGPLPGSAATSATSLRRRRPLNFNRILPLHDRDIRVPGLLPTMVTRIPPPPYPAARSLLPHGSLRTQVVNEDLGSEGPSGTNQKFVSWGPTVKLGDDAATKKCCRKMWMAVQLFVKFKCDKFGYLCLVTKYFVEN